MGSDDQVEGEGAPVEEQSMPFERESAGAEAQPMKVEAESARAVIGEFAGRIAGRCLVGLLLFFGFFLGFFVGGTGFHDPDTCWLLVVGRYIVEHCALPSTDPFSYTFNFDVSAPKPFFVYQWLTEILFFLTFQAGGATALLCFVGCILTLAFIIVPLRQWGKTGAPSVAAVIVVVVGVISASCRCLARPEIFSFLLMGIWLVMLLEMRKEDSFKWRYPIQAALLMVLWVNLHTGFTSGLILLGIMVNVRLAETIWRRLVAVGTPSAANTGASNTGASNTALSAPGLLLPAATFLAAAIGSLLNPRGFALWHYIVFNLFSSPINKRIVETRPISLSDIKEFTYYPFFLIFLFFLHAAWRAIHGTIQASCAGANKVDGDRSAKLSLIILSIITGLMCAYLGFTTKRVVGFSTLALVCEIAFLMSPMFSQSVPRVIPRISSGWSRFSAAAEAVVRPYVPLKLHYAGLVLVLSIFGTFLCSTRIVKPDIPQSSMGCLVPANALASLSKKMPEGNMFNHPQYGDMLLWSFDPPPKVFIDTRFDMYGASFVAEYDLVANAQTGYEAVLQKYRVDWVFMPSNSPLIAELKKSSMWKEVFRDKVAVIMSRNRQ